MFYKYIGTGTNGKLSYSVTLKMYRDCSPPSNNQNPSQLNLTVFNNSGNAYISDYPAPMTNQYTLQKGSFNECISPQPNICYVVLEYNTVITLDPSPLGYTISTQRCCRIDGIVNVASPSNSYGDTYSITIPGNAVNPDYPKNSSPLFAEKDTAVTCFNASFLLDYSATDPDGDQLVYSLTPALPGGSTGTPSPSTASAPPYGSLPYSSGFSSDNPFGTSVSIDANTGIITGSTPSITGEYVLAVRIQEYRNGNFIAETRKELHVFVAGCTLAAAVLPPKIVSCDSFTVHFQNGSTSSNIHTYNWDFGVPGILSDTSTLPDPIFVYPDTGTFYAKLIINKFENCSDSSTSTAVVYPGFKPGFKIIGSCIVNPYQFMDTSKSRYGLVNSWRWDFGEINLSGDTSILKNPQYKYQDLGEKNITFIVGDTKGCDAKVEKLFKVLDRPPLDLAFHDTLICSIDTLQLQSSSAGTFIWTPNFRIANRFTATPSVFPKDTITYFVTVTDGACTNIDSVKINVLDSITVYAGRDTTICRTDSVQLKATSDGLQYQWTPVATITYPNSRSPYVKPINAITVYNVTANLGKCQANDNVTILTIPYPQADAGNDTNVCYSTKAQLHGSIVAASYNWSPSYSLSNNSLSPIASPINTTVYILTVYDTIGCPKPFRDSVIVSVIPKVIVFAGNDTSIIIGQPLIWQLPLVTNAVTYTWTPTTALDNPNLENPAALFQTGTLLNGQDEIIYTLTAKTADGCVGRDEIMVKIFKTGPSIFVPSGFTPNGDGKNDVIRPIVVGMKQLDYFRVYNRMGQLVFSTTAQNTGWDGRINGQLQPTASYVYATQGVDFLGKVYQEAGTFLLIR